MNEFVLVIVWMIGEREEGRRESSSLTRYRGGVGKGLCKRYLGSTSFLAVFRNRQVKGPLSSPFLLSLGILPSPYSASMDYDNPYGAPSSYQVDNSLMRPANLPPLSMQTIGSDRGAPSSGFRMGGPAHGGGAGPDRHAPRRGGYRGAPRGRPPPGRGDRGGSGNGRDYPDRSVNNYPGNSNGYHNNVPFANGGYDRSGYEGDHHHVPQPYMQGGYAGGQGNSYGRDSGFAPPRNEFDGELLRFSSVSAWGKE